MKNNKHLAKYNLLLTLSIFIFMECEAVFKNAIGIKREKEEEGEYTTSKRHKIKKRQEKENNDFRLESLAGVKEGQLEISDQVTTQNQNLVLVTSSINQGGIDRVSSQLESTTEINNSTHLSKSEEDLYSETIKNNNKDVVRELGRRAEQGNANAQNYLGDIFSKGIKCKKNPTMAFSYYEQAASQGHAEAQNNLGNAYHNGFGVGVDYMKAAEYYEKAASQGHANAQYNLGYAYNHSLGVMHS